MPPPVSERECGVARRDVDLFRCAVEASPAAFVLIDASGRIRLVNSQAERTFGYDRAALIGAPVEMLVPDANREKHPGHVARYLAHPRPIAFHARELQARHRDGWLFPVEIGLSPIHTPAGLQVLASVIDITERRLAEKQISRKTRELERSNRELERFAYVVSHDLRSPLRGIATIADWIAADYTDAIGEEGRAQLDLLRDRATRLCRMIEAILEYSRAGRGANDRTDVDAGAVVRGVIELLAPPAEIEVHVDDPLPPCFCNEAQLAQIFQNLIGNAIEHLGKPSGVVTISGRIVEDRVEYRVADDGVGISPDRRSRLFQTFETLSDEVARTAGFGLSIVQRIVQSNDGDLVLEPSPGGGTTFRFTMPGSHE